MRNPIYSYVAGLIFAYFAYLIYNEYKDNAENKSKAKEPKKRKNLFESLFDPSENFDVNFAKDIKARLSDVKGINEVKEEIEQLIRTIKEPKKYLDSGAKLSKGILLSGKPGTGKTLIAKAIAGESGVNFIFTTGSEFDEVFVGVGQKRIKQLFSTARENAPCIIFIDEIDSLLAKSRRSSDEHSSSRGTINQFLSELDGFDKLENVFIIGATNHEKDLDPAAVRPGRFDKKIHIDVPDQEGRQEIIDFYVEKIKMAKTNLDPNYIAKLVPGFTGAEIENLVNTAIINAVLYGKPAVSIDDIGLARDRILMGFCLIRNSAEQQVTESGEIVHDFHSRSRSHINVLQKQIL